MGAFYWTKFRLNFPKFHVLNGTVLWLRLHRPYPSQSARLVIVLVRSIQKCGTEEIWGEQFGQMEKDISFRPTKMRTGQSGPCTFKFRSDQTEVVHSSGCTNRNFRNFGLNGKRPLNYWKCVSNFPSPDWHYWRWLFELFNHGAFSILVNTLPPRTLFRHCFADGLNQKFISVCGAWCRVVRCQVLRIQ